MVEKEKKGYTFSEVTSKFLQRLEGISNKFEEIDKKVTELDPNEQRPVNEAAIDTFMQLLPKMLKKHEGKWVVIKDGEEKPLGFSKSQARAYKRGVKEYGNVSFLLRQVSEEYLEFGRCGRPVTITRNLGV